MSSKAVGGIFLTVGLAISSAGGYAFWSTQNFLGDSQRAQGKVVELSKPPTARYFTPVVQFETADHKIITAVGKVGSNPPAHKVGDSVTVLYRDTTPEDICLDEPLELWLVTSILGGIGSIFVTVGGAMLIYSATRKS